VKEVKENVEVYDGNEEPDRGASDEFEHVFSNRPARLLTANRRAIDQIPI